MTTKEQILKCFKDINHAYNDCTRYDTLKCMLDELQEPCEDCISRQAAIDAIKNYASMLWEKYHEPFPESTIMEMIQELPSVTPRQKWIPVSERLPEDRNWHLGIFKESDTGWINPLPFICDYVGHETKATTKEHWILRGFTDRDEHIDYYFNLECVAWMPLPEPYTAEGSEAE